ncbi:4a-hydroxytetrahydrobiopterin dehydratase [Candidatus Roizmanbacteria bacterium]|nr:4a-hydroxytetrahydrobiopterin dehydratase [Candidatus Roizmanbacteria bacterium]
MLFVMTDDLTSKHCVPCEGGVEPISEKAVNEYLQQLSLRWEVVDGKKIRHTFKFKDFKEAMVFINKVAELAESEGHHPDIHIYYNKVTIELWTHAIGGLFDNDFILAAKIEKILT